MGGLIDIPHDDMQAALFYEEVRLATLAAIRRAKAGTATGADWRLIEVQCGVADLTRPGKRQKAIYIDPAEPAPF